MTKPRARALVGQGEAASVAELMRVARKPLGQSEKKYWTLDTTTDNRYFND